MPLAGHGFYANVQETKEIEIYKDTIRLNKIRRQEVKIAKKTEIKNSTSIYCKLHMQSRYY